MVPLVFVMMSIVKDVLEKEKEERYATIVDILTDIYNGVVDSVPFLVYAKLLAYIKIRVGFHNVFVILTFRDDVNMSPVIIPV